MRAHAFAYSVRNALTGSFLVDLYAGIIPETIVRAMLIPTNIPAYPTFKLAIFSTLMKEYTIRLMGTVNM